jgi:benzoyl-CoA 2,3-epoxidase subunit B
VLTDQPYPLLEIQGDTLAVVQAPALNARNEQLRDDYVKDATAGIERCNRIIEKAGIPFRLRVPHKAFNRKSGPLAAAKIDPDGHLISEADSTHRRRGRLPREEDRAFVAPLTGGVIEPGQFAHWITPPVRGIDNQPVEFDYLRFG